MTFFLVEGEHGLMVLLAAKLLATGGESPPLVIRAEPLQDHISPWVGMFFWFAKELYFLLGAGCLDASHWEGQASSAGKGPQGRLSVEFVNVGGWFTNGDVALDSGAQFPGRG